MGDLALWDVTPVISGTLKTLSHMVAAMLQGLSHDGARARAGADRGDQRDGGARGLGAPESADDAAAVLRRGRHDCAAARGEFRMTDTACCMYNTVNTACCMYTHCRQQALLAGCARVAGAEEFADTCMQARPMLPEGPSAYGPCTRSRALLESVRRRR